MSDMLSSGVSGLLAFQTALNTISNNISNVNTPGYSQQTTDLVTATPDRTGAGWIGNGVAVSSVTRSYSEFLASQTRSANSSYNQFNTTSGLASSIDNMFGSSSTGLSATLQSFSQSIQTMASAPSQTSTRQAVLNSAQNVITQFQSYQGTLTQLGSQVNTQLGTEAGTISSLATSIASLNQQIMAAQNSSPTQPPNSLLDQRDSLIDQLSQHVSVSTVTQSNGAVSVFIGSGQALVVGTTAATLTAGPDKFNSGQDDVSLTSGSGSVNVTSSISGGSLGGLLQFRDQMLIPGENALGQAAVTLTSLVNTQNAAGLDQNGAIGGNLLAVGGPQVLPSGTNQGSASVSAQLTTLSALTTSNYDLKYNGGTSWSATDSASGVTTALTAGAGGPLTVAGLTLTLTGTATAGDEFLVQPTSQAINGLSLVTTDPTKIAAAAPLVSSSGAANTGTASVSAATVPNTAVWTRGNYTITFSSPTAYTVTNASGTVTTGTYTPGTPLTPFNGVDVTLSGTPIAGDTFAITDNVNGTGDNTNALALAGILDQNVLNGGATSLNGAVNAYVGTVGLQTSQAKNGATAQQSVLTSATAAQQSVSGVNLDEQAAAMVQYEQAYQAAAQTIKTADTLFQSLLSAVQG